MKYIRSLFIVFVMFFLIPTINASEISESTCSTTHYRVEVNGNFLGCYDNYNEAKNKMNSHNSTIGNVAIIKYNGKTLNAKYGIAKLTDTNVINIYDMDSRTYLTKSSYVTRNSGVDALLLDHVQSTENNLWYYKVMISGKIGYIHESKITIDPVDTVDELKTYYISEDGYLKHKVLGSGGSYTKNLYKAPLYLKNGVKYYSFDGIYFYDNYEELVTDYKKENNNHYYAINKLPYYNYYLYLPLRAKSDLDVEELNSYMINSLGLDPNELLTGELYQYVLPDNSVEIPNISECDAISNLVLKNACVQQKKFEYADSEYKKAYVACNGDKTCQTQAKNNNVGDWIRYYIGGAKNPLVLNYSNPYQTLNEEQKVELRTKINVCDNTDFGTSISPTLQCIENAYTSMGLQGTSVATLGNIGNRSRLSNQGEAFKSIEDNKGINGIFAFSVARNESGNGQSQIAVAENNLFGMGAYDENPTAHASTYESPTASINGFANMINLNYTSRFLGNKGSGIAGPYASDPYWGEKAVDNYVAYLIATGNNEDFKKHNIGIKINPGKVPVMSSASTSSTKYYETNNEINVPIIVLDKVIGENINGNNIWYKVQSDFNIINGAIDKKSLIYDYNSVGYIHSSYLYVESKEPVINATNISVYQNSVFNKLKGVSAYDAWDGEINLTSSNVVGDINTGVIGPYQLTYTATDSEGNTASKTITVNVVEPEKNIPTINAINKTIFVGQTIDLMAGITASDVEDGDVTSKVTVSPSTIDTTSAKEVSVKYSVTDNDGNLAEKIITVIVSDVFEETNGSFGFEKLKYNSATKKIDLMGYQIITEMNNSLSTDISYSLVLVNQITSEEHVIKLSRITDKTQMPYIISDTKYDYTYSWFNESIDLSTIPQGDYDIYVRARGNGREAKSIFREIFMKELDNKFDKKFEIDGRGYMFRRDYLSNNIPLQLFIRDGGLIASDIPPTIDNMFNSFYSIGLSESNISIKGTSHSIGGNYSTSTPIIRKLVFENVNTYTKYTFDAGYIDNGDYQVTLSVSDGFDKTRAWFNVQSLDLSSLANGTYAIYINTNNGVINDYGELNDIFYKELPNATIKDGREYSISRNENKRFRLELTIKNK